MSDSEKVIKGYTCCEIDSSCNFCPYFDSNTCIADLRKDVFELLKKQSEQKFFVDSDGKMTPLPIQKHGHWIPVKQPTGVGAFGYKELTAQEVTCSECGFTEDVMASAYLYCPECGAKMDWEAKQDET